MADVAAIILAAGESSRFGKPKQLIEHRGQTLLRNAVTAAQSICHPVVVVIGSHREKVEAELAREQVLICFNYEWQHGIGTSIRTGMAAVLQHGADARAVLVLTCDQPFVRTGALQQLIAAWQSTGKPIAAAEYANTLGVPALFDRSIFKELQLLPDQTGAKPIILADPQRVASCLFPAGATDIDTPIDYERLIGEE